MGGEQIQRDRFGGQVGAHAQQLHRGRVLGGDAAHADVPQRGDRVGPVTDLAAGVQLSAPAAQQLQVLLAGHLGAVQPGGGLLQRQRQPAQLLGDLLAGLLVQVGHPGPQHPDRVRQVDHVQVQHLPHRGEPAPAGRDDHMPGDTGRQRPGRQPRPDVLGPVGVIEDQQPSRHVAQPVVHQRLQRLGVSGRVQAQPGGQGGELIRDRGGLLGGDPPHQVIVAGVGVGVFGGQLGLADPAHPVHRMHRHRRPGGQRPRQRAPGPGPGR